VNHWYFLWGIKRWFVSSALGSFRRWWGSGWGF